VRPQATLAGLAEQPTVAASWIVAEPSSAAGAPGALFTDLESTSRFASLASDWFGRLARLFECQACLRAGDLPQARSLAGELVDFDSPVDIELSIFYPLCIRVLILNGECHKALRLVDDLLALLKDSPGSYKSEMLALRAWALQCVNAGSPPVSTVELNLLVEPLTPRELEILRLLKSHLPTPEIANMLALSVNTVRTHIKSVYAKLGVHNRTTAIDVSQKLRILA
jgi:DNA-binding CsgD family transcriptional regulator